jgi:hypothetical protein
VPIETNMQDLEIAKKRLSEKSLTLSIVKNGEIIFETVSNGISGFLEAIEKFGDGLEGASVADRVTGKAIALLCVYAKVKAVYAIILSKGAKSVFEKHAVYHEWENLVENILDINKAGICPFEKLATEISNPKDGYRKLKALQNSLKHGR